MSLRLVSKDFFSYFTGDSLCRYAHKIYFGNSSEVDRDAGRPYPGFPQRPFIEKGERRTRVDFENAYNRSRNWKHGRPSGIEVIEPVVDGSVGCSSSIVVDPREGLIIFQRTRGMLVIRDIHKQGPESETVIDLQSILGECITMKARTLLLRDGESIRLSFNRGRLLVTGEAHEHQLNTAVEVRSGWSSLLSWYAFTPRVRRWRKKEARSAYPSRLWGPDNDDPPRVARSRVQQQTHTLCAVFSTCSHDRGRLIANWYESDFFMTTAAINEYYCISEFDLLQQRLEGVIFPTENEVGQAVSPYEPVHHFTIRKKREYPPLSTFDIAPDTKGKVFYLGFLPPPDRRPVVEVISIPTRTEDDTWTQPTVIKRVTLRTLAKHVESLGAALLRPYWIDFDDGIEVTRDTQMCTQEGKNWKIGEDIVRLRLRGDFVIDGTTSSDECVKLISWYITARPSPRKPSSIQEWRNQKYWEDEELNDPNARLSPWADDSGHVELTECYPTPIHYTMASNLEEIRELPLIPDDLDIDQTRLAPFPAQYWLKNKSGQYTSNHCLLFSTLLDSPDNSMSFDGLDLLKYPPIPGHNDHDFVPPGRHLYATYRATLETNRLVRSKRILERARIGHRLEKEERGHPVESECRGGREERPVVEGKDNKNLAITNEELIHTDGGAGSVSEVYIPPPGHDNGGLRGVFDWKDKRFLVYGKCGSRPSRGGVPASDCEPEKLVIVRYDSLTEQIYIPPSSSSSSSSFFLFRSLLSTTTGSHYAFISHLIGLVFFSSFLLFSSWSLFVLASGY